MMDTGHAVTKVVNQPQFQYVSEFLDAKNYHTDIIELPDGQLLVGSDTTITLWTLSFSHQQDQQQNSCVCLAHSSGDFGVVRLVDEQHFVANKKRDITFL
eukprot:TRINITY_DN15663_c0_g1_i1.p1 TRINITY_DN15663_c0_g1~~TRINITY_DN15663_c0_g1_i1.p1  ORF type:complete len:100 (+),score=21.93 TRINITY_DN15663_c0_g1_i1:65-364(+)